MKIIRLRNKFSGHYINCHDDFLKGVCGPDCYLLLIGVKEELTLLPLSVAVANYEFPRTTKDESYPYFTYWLKGGMPDVFDKITWYESDSDK